jgi:hypothetical protein
LWRDSPVIELPEFEPIHRTEAHESL